MRNMKRIQGSDLKFLAMKAETLNCRSRRRTQIIWNEEVTQYWRGEELH